MIKNQEYPKIEIGSYNEGGGEEGLLHRITCHLDEETYIRGHGKTIEDTILDLVKGLVCHFDTAEVAFDSDKHKKELKGAGIIVD